MRLDVQKGGVREGEEDEDEVVSESMRERAVARDGRTERKME